MTLKLLIGADAIECAGAEDFQSKWKALHEVCPWATAYQHPDFVFPWYEIYQSIFLPIIVYEENAAGFLVGLLTLALHRQGTTISGAGEQQAEYQGWLYAATSSDFIVAAILQIQTVFPGKEIFLKYLPPGIPEPVSELEANREGLVSIRYHRRPLMMTDLAAMERQRRKKNHRQNFNRLARSGNLQFKKIIDHDDFIELFDAICAQYDFRQAALYRDMPFSTDPFKKTFYLELHKRGVLHAVALTVDNQVVAAHVGLLSRQHAVHLGITTYDPVRAVHSPGNLLLAMLGLQLSSEAISWLDLTPGGDSYKEHFATEHDTVSELRIYSSKLRRWQYSMVLRAKDLVKQRLVKAGYRPADLMARIQRLNSLSAADLRGVPAALGRRYRSRLAVLRYCAKPAPVDLSKLPVSKDDWRDILQLDAGGSSIAYCNFVSAAMQKMARSDRLYSFVLGKRLAICCWARINGVNQTAPESPVVASLLDQGVVLFDLYVHADIAKNAMLPKFFNAVFADIAKSRPAQAVYYHGRTDAALRTLLLACDFVDVANMQPTVKQRSGNPVIRPSLTEEKET